MADSKTSDPEAEEAAPISSRRSQGESKSIPPSATGTPTAPTSEEDNMDYDSDDDEDSKSNHSSSNRANRGRAGEGKGDVKRSHHNVLERKRRDLIKDSFARLRDAVPTLTNERASRAQILKRAADFIQFTHQRNENFRAGLDKLIKKNAELALSKNVETIGDSKEAVETADATNKE